MPFPIMATVAAIDLGISLYDRYQKGRAASSINYNKMIKGREDVFEEESKFVNEGADLRMKGIQNQQEDLSIRLRNQNIGIRSSFESMQRKSGFAESGTVNTLFEREQESIYDAYSMGNKQFALAREGSQLQRESSLYDLFKQKEQDISNLKAQKSAAKAWYPGKNIGKGITRYGGGALLTGKGAYKNLWKPWKWRL